MHDTNEKEICKRCWKEWHFIGRPERPAKEVTIMSKNKFYIVVDEIEQRSSKKLFNYYALGESIGRFIRLALMFGAGFLIGQFIRGILQAFGVM